MSNYAVIPAKAGIQALNPLSLRERGWGEGREHQAILLISLGTLNDKRQHLARERHQNDISK